jgi:YVTN family beta-propeller protein
VSLRPNFRLLFITLLLAALAALQVSREERPSILAAGQRLRAYVANAGDGTISVLDLVGLSTVATLPVGRAPSSLQALPARNEIWGVSGSLTADAGQVWVLGAGAGVISARIPVGPAPTGVAFSPDGRHAYVAISGANSVVAIDTAARRIV